ncbi:hypothetical protein K505DRAFT_401163 [Melanomma pulvis-pyrius CBS 109.77]|uniref:Uncharacterized protein n=1 Tax=Melanomma pulvis-pyrius CBS 109.77 TaxID=1314802 RepID=A0A6A6XK72_9PLEO|nr:hypothetical protein K505DRAFT_401163 [Melanomma pulvis-pyrius CBS 109.77]
MLVLLLICVLLILLPILYDQYHRTALYSSKSSPSRTPTSSKPSPSPAAIPSNLDGGPDEQEPGSIDRSVTGMGTAMARQDAAYQRKPWDPPFPRAPTIPRQDNKNPSSALSYLGGSKSQSQTTSPPSQPPQNSSQSPPETTRATQHPSHTAYSARPSLLRIAIFVMAVIIFMLTFAILIAHCLAWFVVYKTEARLGEVRKGVLRGGDMRVCLCAS